MFKYNVKIRKVSGRLNESVLPSKSLVVKSKTKKTNKQVFAEASKYFKKKYGLVIESLEVTGFDGEEPSNVTTGNTNGDASFTKSSNSNTVKIGDYEIQKGKWFRGQFRGYEFYKLMGELLYEIQGKKVHYIAEDNERTGSSREFSETDNEVRKFSRRDEEQIIEGVTDDLKGKDVSVDCIIKGNELEIHLSRQYSGDWVEYKEQWFVSL